MILRTDREYIEESGYAVLGGDIPVSTVYGSALDMEKAITETSLVNLNDRASKLAQSMTGMMAEFGKGRQRDERKYHQTQAQEGPAASNR